MLLTVQNNQALNPLFMDLSGYPDVGNTEMDPADPSFTTKVISHSLLREGGALGLEDFKNKELVFPLIFGPFVSNSAMAQAIATLNQILTTPGASAAWQDDGMSQATTFDLISSSFDVAYNYRRAQHFYTNGTLRLYAQPLGRTAGPRSFARASGVGPLLMISPYGSAGTLSIGASGTGFGGRPYGASSGVFYTGAPSLAGDVPALLQVGLSGVAIPFQIPDAPYTAFSVLPDQHYHPLITWDQLNTSGGDFVRQSTAVASAYYTTASPFTDSYLFVPSGSSSGLTGPVVPLSWAGDHRLFMIARASGQPVAISTSKSSYVANPVVASVAVGDWGLYDMGTYTQKASQAAALIGVSVPNGGGGTGVHTAVDITAFVSLPDRSTWFFNPNAVDPTSVSLTNQALVLNDVLGDQFNVFTGGSSAPAPDGSDSQISQQITQYSRGLVPRPDPQQGLPIFAVLGIAAASPNPQNRGMSVQINVLERARYVLP